MVLLKQFPVPTEGIKLQGPNVEAFIDNDHQGKGNLFVTEANIAWVEANTGEGFKIAYKKMTLHAISRDPGVHSRACLYIMLNGNVLDEDENFEVECPLGMEASDEEMTEIRFVPDDESALDEMYKAVQECSLLHPDPSSDLSNEEEEEDEDEEDPHQNFPGVYIPEGGYVNQPEEDESHLSEAEQLERFLRRQLNIRNYGHPDGDDDPDRDNNGDGGNGNPGGLSFIPEPGQFDDV